MPITKIIGSCEITDINWDIIEQIPDRLQKHNGKVESLDLEFSKDRITYFYDNLSEFVSKARELKPLGYGLAFSLKEGKRLSISRGWNLHSQEYLYVSLQGFGTDEPLFDIMNFLNLTVAKVSSEKETKRSAFIAHKFDQLGQSYADRLAHFLKFLGFETSSGRTFAPKSIAEKVKERLEKQGIVFMILSSGEESSWQIQESAIASISKPLFILKEEGTTFESGILSDHEYIPFINPNIETTFIPILEGYQHWALNLIRTWTSNNIDKPQLLPTIYSNPL
ncbi:MAG: hypothetical protein KGZ58_11555 [Ignavibacteriales bacterium]|nr:hypothetical protein [Ignavibacteriales bacterium]